MSAESFSAAAQSLYGVTPAPAAAPTTPATSAAQSLYGGTPAPTSAPASTPATETPRQELADALYDRPDTSVALQVPPEVAKLRSAEESGLYSRISGFESVPFEDALKGIEAPPEVLKAAAQEYRHMAADLGANVTEAGQLLATIQGLVKTPPTPEQATKMQGDAAEQVVAKYGEEAGAMLDLAKRMVARDPRIKSMLHSSGAGNDPRTVMTMVELAVRQRAAGKLK